MVEYFCEFYAFFGVSLQDFLDEAFGFLSDFDMLMNAFEPVRALFDAFICIFTAFSLKRRYS